MTPAIQRPEGSCAAPTIALPSVPRANINTPISAEPAPACALADVIPIAKAFGMMKPTSAMSNKSAPAMPFTAPAFDIEVASGSSDTDAWLGPWFIYDALDLVKTSDLTQKLTSIAVTSPPAIPTAVASCPTTDADGAAYTRTVMP